MAQNLVELNIGYYPDPTKGRPIAGGTVFVGIPDLDPEILANRVTITFIQEDGTEVPILPAAQPLDLSAGGTLEFQGTKGQFTVDGNYSLKVLDKNDAQVYNVTDSFSGFFDPTDIPIEFDNVADLKASSGLIVNQIAETKGYTSAGDEGGARYLIAAPQAVDGFGDHLLANGNVALIQIENGVFNVRQFGATGDGATNDTPSVQATVLASSGHVILPSGDYFFDDGGVSLNNITSINIEGVPGGTSGGTVITIKNDINGTAFFTDETNTCDSFYAKGFHVRCTSIVDNGTAQQALQSKNVNITNFEDITTDKLSQFAIMVGHFETGATESESVTLVNCQVMDHGKSSVTTQVGIEFIERNNASPGSAPHPFVKNKYIENCSVELSDGVEGALMKLGTAENITVINLILTANDRGGTSGALEVAGTSVIDRMVCSLNQVRIYDSGTPSRSAIFCGEVKEMIMNDVIIESSQPAVALDVTSAATTPRTLNVNNCDFGASIIFALDVGVSADDVGRVINVNNSTIGGVSVKASDGPTGIAEINIYNNSFLDTLEITRSVDNITVKDSNVDFVNFFEEGEQVDIVKTLFVNSFIKDWTCGWLVSTWDTLEFIGGSFGDGSAIRTIPTCRPENFILTNTIIPKATTEHQYDAGVAIVMEGVVMVDNQVSGAGNAIFARAPDVRINNCTMEDILVTDNIMFLGTASAEIFARLSSFSTVDRGVTTILDTATVGNVHWRGAVIQDVFTATLDE